MMQIAETKFNLDKHLVSFLQDSPFFAAISLRIQKYPTRSLPTAAVSYDEKSDQICLWWNPDFFSKLSDREVRGVLRHEFYHLVFGHLTGRRRKPPQLWNIATDLAINSIIVSAEHHNTNLQGDRDLPDFCLIPGRIPANPEGREWTPEEKKSLSLLTIIKDLPTMQPSEWYFDKLLQELPEEQLAMMAAAGMSSMDDHDGWDSIPEEKREYIEGKVKAIIEKAVKEADSRANGWGNIPEEIVRSIRKSVSNTVNWRTLLRQFVGSTVRGGRSTSIKRINKRYPYIHPGVKKGYEAKILVAIDQSGSVGDEMLVEFFAELGSLTKKTTIDVVPFDTEALQKDVYTWRKGQTIAPRRVRCGGTDFDAPTRLANDPKNRGRWDGLLILTDGGAPKPAGSRVKRGWVLGRGTELYFGKTDEVVVRVGEKGTATGAWR